MAEVKLNPDSEFYYSTAEQLKNKEGEDLATSSITQKRTDRSQPLL
jgi:hypothetical protein